MFGCVAWAHISDDYMKKLDAKSHACIMMGYSEESKAYQLFDPVKQQTIIECNVIFDDNTSRVGLLKSPSSSYNDPFGIIEDIRLTISPMCISTNSAKPMSTYDW
jgi:hypothetical protein